MRSRVILLVLFFAAIFGLLNMRLFYLQVLPHTELDRLKKVQYTTVIALPPQRGKILDRLGEELASSIMSKSLFADPTQILSPRSLAKKLAPLLHSPYDQLLAKLKMKRRFIWLKRQMEDDEAEEIKSWQEPGLGFVEEGRRFYPNQNLLAPVLGFVGSEGNGLEGLERKYDEELRGERQSVVTKRDARGRPLLVNGQIFEMSADGASLETTIDKELQYYMERELEDVTKRQQAERATGIIMDPATGEVLAIGSYPSFDPSKATVISGDLRRDHAIGDVFEPGSTFKIVAAAAALRTGRIFPNSKYFCEHGKFKIGKRTIHEAEASGFGWLTMAEILQVSSNIGATKVVFDVGQYGFRDMISSFGFTSKTGIDLIGEAAGLQTGAAWPEHLLSNVSFGHGIGVTAIQVANAYSVVANGGKLMKPFIVKRVVDSDGQAIYQRNPQVIRQVLSPKEAATLTLMLSGVTEDGGTGTLAKVDGYPVAGKTGTAQKVDPHGRGYMKGGYLSSFAGFVPANNPQFTIYVMVDHPKKESHGGQVAAPVFQRLASFALHRRGFMPIVVNENSLAHNRQEAPRANDEAAATSAVNQQAITERSEVVPSLAGLTVREVAERLRNDLKTGHDAQLIGSGLVHSQWPAPGSPWTKYQKLKVYFRDPVIK